MMNGRDKIQVEIETEEAYYAVNSISAAMRFMNRYAKKNKVFHDRYASLEGLKEKLLKSMKEQSSIEALREAKQIIENEETQ